jgi:hypothetical protein
VSGNKDYFRQIWTTLLAPPKHQSKCVLSDTISTQLFLPSPFIVLIVHMQCKDIQKCVPSKMRFVVIPYWPVRMFSPVCVWDGHTMLKTCPERLDRLRCRLQLLLVRLWHHCRSCCISERRLFTWRKVWWWHRCIWQRSWLHILIVFVNRRRARTFLNWPPRTKRTAQKFSFKGVTMRPTTTATSVFYKGADKSLTRPEWKNNWEVATFRLTRRSLLPRRPGWTANLLNFFWVGCKS